jgi:ribonuclease HII
MTAGIDEVGRGCLSGPVVSSSVILPDSFSHDLITDSKKLSKKKREIAYGVIMDNALHVGIGYSYPAEIDEINILQATFRSMFRSIDELGIIPEMLLVDGDKFPGYQNIPFKCIIKGDSKIPSISAASIIAKVTRDRFMENLSMDYPEYLWEKNSGYGTKDHMNAIENHGLTEHHRRSFCSRFIKGNSIF